MDWLGMSFWVGLTGGIAAGKTSVADLFKAKGVPVLNADEIAKALCEPGHAGFLALEALLKKRFPYTAQKTLDRSALRIMIFEDPALRMAVEKTLHPLIRTALIDASQTIKAPYLILEVPLLIENAWHKDMQRVLVVDTPESLQIERLMARDQIDATLAKKMLAAQLSRKERLAHATDVIDNTVTPVELAKVVEKLHQRFLALATQSK